MSVSQEENMRRHIEWCRETLAADRRALSLYEDGSMSLHSNGKDITAGEVERLQRSIEYLEDHLDSLGLPDDPNA